MNDGGLRDPGDSAAVLIGVGAYRRMPKLPTVANNLTRLDEALTNARIWGLPADRCVTVPDPTASDDMITPVVEAAGLARDILIVYYAGHGFVDKNGSLRLTVVGSREDRPHTAVLYSELREALLEHNRARRLVIVLDCCYSGRALGNMAGKVTSLRTAAGVKDSYLLTSAAENVKALAPRDEECTAFTGELVKVLQNGIQGEDGKETPPYLTLDMIYERVRDSLSERGRPRPQQQDNGQLGRLPFVRNLARPTPPPPPPPPVWRRPLTIAAAALLVPALTLAADSAGAPSDICSPQASLIGFSDALDKATYRGQGVIGLSSLAMSGPSTALTLADNSPPFLYSLSLGEPGGRPDVRITAMRRLLTGDEGFDGEAIALEKGGKTVLVASEAAPSISRFDLSTGRRLYDLPIPDRYRTPPTGSAVTNAIFESLALTPDARHLYVGLEEPLGADGARQGRYLIRILRYTGTPGGRYVPDAEFAYETEAGLRLADLVPTGNGDRFLALERGYAERQGNSVLVYEISFTDLPDLRRIGSLADVDPALFIPKREVVDMGDCPTFGAKARQPQSNPLLDNAEGMALGPRLTEGPHKGRRPLYLVTDDNNNPVQLTRFYALAVDGL